MPIFHAIAAMSENRVIGHQGKIPWHIPEDFRWFKHKTMGGTLIMGRKTFESIGKPLPGRKTVVLTRSNLTIPGVETRSDLDSLIKTEISNAWVCGGADVYQQLLSKCVGLYITRIKRSVEGDNYFPPFEQLYTLNQVIHETSEFRVERWFNKNESWRLFYEPPPEDWPFAQRR